MTLDANDFSFRGKKLKADFYPMLLLIKDEESLELTYKYSQLCPPKVYRTELVTAVMHHCITIRAAYYHCITACSLHHYSAA